MLVFHLNNNQRYCCFLKYVHAYICSIITLAMYCSHVHLCANKQLWDMLQRNLALKSSPSNPHSSISPSSFLLVSSSPFIPLLYFHLTSSSVILSSPPFPFFLFFLFTLFSFTTVCHSRFIFLFPHCFCMFVSFKSPLIQQGLPIWPSSVASKAFI